MNRARAVGTVVVTLVLLSAAASGQTLSAAPPKARSVGKPTAERFENPALARFGKDVIFSVSFDDGLTAEVAPESKEPLPGDWQAFVKGGGELFAAGAFGRALESGEFTVGYDLGTRPQLAQSGSIVCWIAGYDRPPGDNDYFWPARLRLGKRSLMFGQMRGTKNNRPLYAYTEGLGQKASVRQGDVGWPDGTWHLVVVNWRPDSVEISVDGQPPSRDGLRQPVNFEGGKNGLVVSVKRKRETGGFLIDELMVLATPLEAGDIEWIQAHGPPGTLATAE